MTTVDQATLPNANHNNCRYIYISGCDVGASGRAVASCPEGPVSNLLVARFFPSSFFPLDEGLCSHFKPCILGLQMHRISVKSN